MKKFNYLLLTIVGLFAFCSTVSAITFNHADIPESSTIIGKALYSRERNESSELYSGVVDTSAVMMGSSSVSTSSFNSKDSFVIYYKWYNADPDDPETYPEEWRNLIDNSTIDNSNIPEEFEILYINGVCVDPSCDGSTYATVSFESTNPDDLFSDKSIKVRYGEKINSSELPKFLNRPGYKFMGWTLKDEDEEFDFSTPITEDITLETNWEPIEYNITFTNGTNNEEKTCYYDVDGRKCSFIEYNLAVRQNYSFVGWTTSSPTDSGAKVVYHVGDDMAPVLGNDSNVTLYAVYEPVKYDVKFNLNGGTLNGQETIMSKYSIEDTAIKLPSNPTRVGYKFVEWQYNNKKYNNEIVAGGMTLTAKWDKIEYSFKYKNNSPIVCKYDEDCTINATADNVEGKTFSRWYVMVNSKKVYLNTTVRNFTAQETTTPYVLTPEYVDNYYTINYNYDGGKASGNNVDTYTYVNNKNIDLTAPTKDGYTFRGWTVISGKAEINNNKLVIKGAGNISVKANFVENTYTIKYFDGTNSIKEESCAYSKCKTIAAITKDEFDFVGWVTDTGLVFDAEKALVAVDTYQNAGVINLKAKWTNKYRYIVSYDLDGGLFVGNESARAQNSYLEGESITLPEVTKEGYVFLGWELDGNVISGQDTISGYKKDLHLVAKWEGINYTINYHNEKNVVIGTDTCKYGEECTLTRHDSIFTDDKLSLVGWSKEGVNGSLFYGDGLKVLNLTSNPDVPLDLYVVYNDDNVYYEVEFILGEVGQFKNPDNNSIVTYKEGDVLVLPEVEVKADAGDYEFAGWYIGDELFTEESLTIVNDVKLEARWIKLNKYENEVRYNDQVLASAAIRTKDKVVTVEEDGTETYTSDYMLIDPVENFQILVSSYDMTSTYTTSEYNYYKITFYLDDTQLSVLTMKTADKLLLSNDVSGVTLNSDYAINKEVEGLKVIFQECNEDFTDLTDGLNLEI